MPKLFNFRSMQCLFMVWPWLKITQPMHRQITKWTTSQQQPLNKQNNPYTPIWFFLSTTLPSFFPQDIYFSALPSHNCTTAYLPLQAHFLAPLSPPPFSVARRRSSSPEGSPTTTSALQVRRASVRIPDPGPRGPMAVVKGVVGSQDAWSVMV
jgi:hypothetical protein